LAGSKNLVIFLGIGLVIVRFWTSSQRTALASLWNVGATGSPTPAAGGYSTQAACKKATGGACVKGSGISSSMWYSQVNNPTTVPQGMRCKNGALPVNGKCADGSKPKVTIPTLIR
jgi:hypothetical protein